MKLHSDKRESYRINTIDGKQRVIINDIKPNIDNGLYCAKRCIGEVINVEATIFSDCHDELSCFLSYHHHSDSLSTSKQAMVMKNEDVWQASFLLEKSGYYFYSITAWTDEFKTLHKIINTKISLNEKIDSDIKSVINLIKKYRVYSNHENINDWIDQLNINHIDMFTDATFINWVSDFSHQSSATNSPTLKIMADPPHACFSAWYEVFPRSLSPSLNRQGTLRDLINHLPNIKQLGFDIVYLPPIHPIGQTARKGKNNSLESTASDVGSPWAIGDQNGGHMAVHPELGSLNEFKLLVAAADHIGLKIALDFVLQCSPDHPYIRLHPTWFKYKADGTLQTAENPPKKYEDTVPFNFESNDWQQLWQECLKIIIFWIEKGVTIFRVDNPHTKPFKFWEWLIYKVKNKYPEVIFLAESFTRPTLMRHLAKIGFSQSYTYFIWRTTKAEIEQYMKELTTQPLSDFYRPNFWPNTPDILPNYLQNGGRPAFIARLILAATLSTNYGIYGPVFENCVNSFLTPNTEEYLDSEKYEVKRWLTDKPENSIADIVAKINKIRNEHKALQNMRSLEFHYIENPEIICYSKIDRESSDNILVILNLDYNIKQSGSITLSLERFGIINTDYQLVDLLTNIEYIWHGSRNYVELDPNKLPAHIFHLK